MNDIHSIVKHLVLENESSATFTPGVGEQHADKRLMESEDEQFQIGDVAEVMSKGYPHYGERGRVVDLSPQDGSFVTLEFGNRTKGPHFHGDMAIYHVSQLSKEDEYADEDDEEDDDNDLVFFTVDDERLDDILHDRFGSNLELEGELYSLPGETFDRFSEYASRKKLDSHITITDPEDLKETPADNLYDDSETVSETFSPEDYQKAANLLDKVKSTSSKLYSALIQMIMDTRPHSSQEIDSAVSKFGLNESYSRFKKETSKRARKKQYYEGLKMAESKMKEAKSIVEYVSRLKEEMSGELPLEENSFMRKLKERMTRTIAEMYSKYKSL